MQPQTPDPTPGAGAQARPRAAIAANLRSALGLFALRPAAAAGLRPGGLQCLALLALNLAAALAYDLHVTDLAAGSFDPAALPAVSFWALAAVVSAWVIAALAADEALFGTLAVAAYGLSLVTAMAGYALAIGADYLTVLDRAYRWLAWAPIAWGAFAYAVAALRIARPGSRWRRLAVVACALLLPLAAQWATDPSQRLWNAPDATGDDGGDDGPAAEQSLYGQGELLARQLDGLVDGQTGVTQLFTITFAADGRSDVFLNEAQNADQALADAYGSGERGVVLGNSVARPQEAPFATVHSLEQTLDAVAGHMKPDEDVLLLLLSSSGVRDGGLGVALPPYRFGDLSPRRLRELLDDSGIRYRVVVVSTCYAGPYLDALAGEDSLVIVASGAEERSFDCGGDGDWTGFGEAFFERALPRSDGFESAFARARQLVAEREQAEGRSPSRPQISVGAGIRARLAALATQRGHGVLYARAPGVAPVR